MKYLKAVLIASTLVVARLARAYVDLVMAIVLDKE
jgi:hypothetical protein